MVKRKRHLAIPDFVPLPVFPLTTRRVELLSNESKHDFSGSLDKGKDDLITQLRHYAYLLLG
jgi:hypothetical protein